MKNPFKVHVDDIKNPSLKDRESVAWVESSAPKDPGAIEYLKPSLKSKNVKAAIVIFVSISILMLGRSAQLQILEHKKHYAEAESNRLRIIRQKAPRGDIFDRNGIPLTSNIPRFQLVLDPFRLPRDKDPFLGKLSNIVGEDIKTAVANLKQPISSIILKTNLTLEETYPLIIATQEIPGVSIESTSVREYAKGDKFSHVLGYLGKIDQEEVQKYLDLGYGFNDLIGKTGIEKSFEISLHGKDGRKHVEVDAVGNIQNIVAFEDVVPGKDLTLTIDSELQAAATDILERYLKNSSTTKGSLVVLDPNNGEILAFISLPNFDNNIFTSKKSSVEEIKSLFENSDQPLFNRTISGIYPSGSSIKPIFAAAALQEGIINQNTSFLSTGGLRIGQWFFPDWRPNGHGLTNVTHALADSVNTFFYIIGGGYSDIKGLGIERLGQYLKMFGINDKVGTELENESAGFVPDAEWKIQNKGEQWYIGDTYHLSIGQGDLLVTPLHIARMISYFATSGKWVQPHFVKNENQTAKSLAIDPTNIEIVREGLREAVVYGSARSLSSLPVASAGKTGTAQWSSTKNPHAWFAGWAPFKDPQISITALVEEGGGDSRTVSSVARDVIQWWLDHRK